MSVNEYLERARRYESQEGWQEALDLYQRALARMDEEGSPSDPSLVSRVGDLQLRLKRPRAAAEAYDRATELHIRGNDLDGAFAVCQKVIRHLPDNEEVYLRIARIRAMQGYTEWARQHYLTYAQMTGSRGEREQAVRALEELVSVVPGDVDTRLFVAERLVAEGRREDAMIHLREGHRRAFAAADRKGLERLRARIHALDPQAILAELPEGATARPQGTVPAADVASDGASEQEVVDAPAPPAPPARKAGSWSRLLGALGLAGSAGGASRRGSGRDAAAPGDAPASGETADTTAPTQQPAWAATADEEGAAAAPVAEGSEEMSEEVAAAAVAEESVHGAMAAAAEGVEGAADAAAVAADEGAALVTAEVRPASPPSSTDGDEPSAERDGAPAPEVGAAPGPLLGTPAGGEEMVLEEAEVRRLLALEPYEVAHHERFVRFAARTGDQALLIHGLQHMAMALRAAGLEWRAKSTLARILSMDPENQRALEALGYGAQGSAADPFLRPMVSDPAVRPVGPVVAVPQPAHADPITRDGEPTHPFAEDLVAAVEGAVEAALTGATAAAPAAETDAAEAAALAAAGVSGEAGEAEPEGGWVDLGALILDEPEDHGTRWQVEFEEPTEDEDADFASILAQFKEKVSEHLERSDARAHYDLGAAYRGMGLLPEAISMFQNALRAEPDFLPATEMLGRCFLENGDPHAAVAVLRRALDLEVPVEDDLLGVYYYLGNAYESLGKPEDAKDLYTRIFSRDINFIDVTERLRDLR